MKTLSFTALALPAILVTVILAACGGGGSSSPSTPPGVTGQLAASSPNLSFANTEVLFSCGCSGQAGSTTSDSNGNFTIPVNSVAVPSSPSPTYTLVPGRNYVIVGDQTNGTQAWTMEFVGNTPSTNLSLYGMNGATITDTDTAATALYVYYQSRQFVGDQAYTHWNFNSLINWTGSLKQSGGSNSAERQYLSDIVAAQTANHSLFPVPPAWDPKAGATPADTPNATLVNDIQAVAASADATLPTPCPTTGCTGTPLP